MPTVSKATSRKRGAAKVVRAAQQTPLPGDAVTETIEPSDNLDTMSVGELRKLMTAQGWSTGTKGTKRELIALLRRHPDGPPKQAAAKKAQPASDVDDVESKPSAQVDAKRCKEIGTRMLAERKKYTRGVLADAAGSTPSLIWRWEQGRPKPDELHIIDALFARIDAGELTAPERKIFGAVQGGPTKADLTSTVEQVRHVLSEVPSTGLKVGQARTAINECLDLIEKTLSSSDE